jgi:hypothetical protein
VHQERREDFFFLSPHKNSIQFKINDDEFLFLREQAGFISDKNTNIFSNTDRTLLSQFIFEKNFSFQMTIYLLYTRMHRNLYCLNNVFFRKLLSDLKDA